MSDQAKKVHSEAIIIDPCVQFLIKHTERTAVSGLTAAGLTIPMPGDDLTTALPRVRDFLDIIAQEPAFCLADTPQAIRDAKAQGKMAHILLAQDSLIVGHNPKNLLLWKQLGLRVMQLTYNEQNLAGTGCLEQVDGGLTRYGRVLIREMETVGITLDLTHVGERSFMEAAATATKPFIASHSNPKSVVDNPRNISDDQIKAVADSGGVVCVTTWAPLIWDGSPCMPTLDDYFRCLEYVIELVGVDHAGISTDSMGTTGAYPKHDPDPDALPYGSVTDEFDRLAQPPDNNNRQPSDFNGLEDYPYLVSKMVARGYSDEDVKKLLGGNLLRVFEATWKPEFYQ
ncbi:MAG: membrane dipeptidase [Chloroflexota bacterium]